MIHVQLQSDDGEESEGEPEVEVSRRAIRRRREVEEPSIWEERGVELIEDNAVHDSNDNDINSGDSDDDEEDESESDFSFEDDSEYENRRGSAVIASDNNPNVWSDEEEENDDEDEEDDEEDMEAIRKFNEERSLLRIKRMTRLLSSVHPSSNQPDQQDQLFTTDEIEKHNLHSFLCPISHHCFIDPVVAPDGHTYERESIVEWLRENNNSPMTNKPMSMQTLYHNHTLRASMQTTRSLLNALMP